ncbi:Hypothetical_protein [Hexamita inflata]|uniref:Hypothetical_protein n=1 Tax=Hexamita inflata TaxID=28002 RepID=A0AA86PSN5_9EUKA|nr:Hypothetical protein HINF_LOCUS30458 [Hexamita inflata]
MKGKVIFQGGGVLIMQSERNNEIKSVNMLNGKVKIIPKNKHRLFEENITFQTGLGETGLELKKELMQQLIGERCMRTAKKCWDRHMKFQLSHKQLNEEVLTLTNTVIFNYYEQHYQDKLLKVTQQMQGLVFLKQQSVNTTVTLIHRTAQQINNLVGCYTQLITVSNSQ